MRAHIWWLIGACVGGLSLAAWAAVRGLTAPTAGSPIVHLDQQDPGRPPPYGASLDAQSSPQRLPLLSAAASDLPTEATSIPALLEERRLTLEFPSEIRLGDSDVVRLTFEASGDGTLVSSPEVQAQNPVGVSAQLQNAYETYNVVAEAQLDLAGAQITPYGPVSEPLLPGQPTAFAWSVRPQSPGTSRGTVWLFLIFTDKETGTAIREPMTAQSIVIQSTSLLGLPGTSARIAGGLGLLAGVALVSPIIKQALPRPAGRRRAEE